MNKEERRKEKIRKLALAGGTDKDLEILDAISELEDKIDAEIPSIKDVISRMKGDPGKDADPPTDEKIISLIKPLIPVVKNGENYIITDKDKKEIAKSIPVPIVEKKVIVERTEVIKEIPIVTNNVTNEVKEVAVTDNPTVIADKLNTLKEVVEPDVIKGFRELERMTKLNAFNPTMGPSFADLKNINTRIDNLPTSGGAITSSDSSLTIAGTDVIINTAHQNTWSGTQEFSGSVKINDLDVYGGNTTISTAGGGSIVNDGSFAGTRFRTLGGTSNDFVKGDGTLDNTNYLSSLSSDGSIAISGSSIAIEPSFSNTWTATQYFGSGTAEIDTSGRGIFQGGLQPFGDISENSGAYLLDSSGRLGLVGAGINSSHDINATNWYIANTGEIYTSSFANIQYIGLQSAGANSSYDIISNNWNITSGGVLRINTINDASGNPAIDLSAHTFYSQFTTSVSLNWDNRTLSDYSGNTVLDWANNTQTANFLGAIQLGTTDTPVSNVKFRLRSNGTNRAARFENSTVVGGGYGGVDMFLTNAFSSDAYTTIRFTASDVGAFAFNLGSASSGALGVGGTTFTVGSWSTGQAGQIGFTSNMTDYVNEGIGPITWSNATGDSINYAGAQLEAYTEDTERKAVGVRIQTSQNAPGGYPTNGFWITSEQVGAQGSQVVGYGYQGIQPPNLGFDSRVQSAIFNYNNGTLDEGLVIANGNNSLGSELVTNPGFTGNATGWTLGTGWAYSSNSVIKNADGTGTLSQTISGLVVGQLYMLTIDMLTGSGTIGTATATIGGVTLRPKLRFGGQSNQYMFTADGTSMTLTITPSVSTSRFGGFDNISIKKPSKGGIHAAGKGVFDTGVSTGSFTVGYVSKTANYTATEADHTIEYPSSTSTLTLPTAVGITGREYEIVNSGTGVITIATTSSQTINGSTTVTLNTQYSCRKVRSNGANWMIVAVV